MRPARLATGFAAVAMAKWLLRFAGFCFGPDETPEEEVVTEEDTKAEAENIPNFITVYRISPDGPEPEAILKKEQP